MYSAPVLGENGSVYFGSNDGYFYCLSDEGNLNWRCRTGGKEDGSALVSQDNLIYFNSCKGIFYVCNSDGTVQWKTPTGWLKTTPPVMGKDGNIYLGGVFPLSREINILSGMGNSGAFYALKTGSKGATPKTWFKNRADNSNTGRANF